MKKTTLMITIIFLLLFVGVGIQGSDSSKDFLAIKSAVAKKNLTSKNKIAWLKILVTDNIEKKVIAQLTLPISLVEPVIKNCDGKIEIEGKCDIDFKKILKKMKEKGPFTILKIKDKKETIKIWLE